MRIKRNYSGTEYTGNTHPNTLPAKHRDDRVTAQEAVRLLKLTGQTQDPTAPPDRRVWLGLKPAPDSVIDFDD